MASWWLVVAICGGCVIGAIFGYALGYYLVDLIGQWIIDSFFSAEQFENVKSQMDSQGFWFVMTLGIAPIPFQVAMLAAGATKFSLPLFLIATVIARSLRYFGLAAVVYYAGDKAEQLIKRYRMKAVIAITLIVLLLWWLSNLIS